ncbi:hypothetical protein HELRODRAFT_181019 [Helobdella robusta]|uniref:Uncharacterized protein n=1 Tax=Helobdella robusta TaxID=6412 RepID=T1FGJ3_HELRO|nr:hypothetical protein HELRODRAFT_181019 [Helobdella robusta]ESN93276.1 hypothetical protein HELRODRAFT_181019 [Helobdella robusta]
MTNSKLSYYTGTNKQQTEDISSETTTTTTTTSTTRKKVTTATTTTTRATLSNSSGTMTTVTTTSAAVTTTTTTKTTTLKPSLSRSKATSKTSGMKLCGNNNCKNITERYRRRPQSKSSMAPPTASKSHLKRSLSRSLSPSPPPPLSASSSATTRSLSSLTKEMRTGQSGLTKEASSNSIDISAVLNNALVRKPAVLSFFPNSSTTSAAKNFAKKCSQNRCATPATTNFNENCSPNCCATSTAAELLKKCTPKSRGGPSSAAKFIKKCFPQQLEACGGRGDETGDPATFNGDPVPPILLPATPNDQIIPSTAELFLHTGSVTTTKTEIGDENPDDRVFFWGPQGGPPMLMAADEKMKKYGNALPSMEFLPICIEVLGPMDPNTLKFLKEICKMISVRSGDSRELFFATNHISCLLQRFLRVCVLENIQLNADMCN